MWCAHTYTPGHEPPLPVVAPEKSISTSNVNETDRNYDNKILDKFVFLKP